MKRWLFRCAPWLTSATVVTVTYLAFRAPVDSIRHDPVVGGRKHFDCASIADAGSKECLPPSVLTYPQLFYLAYNYLVHLQMFLFCPQLCIALWYVTKKMRETQSRTPSKVEAVGTPVQDGSLSPKSKEEFSPVVAPAMHRAGSPEEQIVHAIIVPNYKEDIGTLRETLMVFASHQQAKSQYEVSLYNFLRAHFVMIRENVPIVPPWHLVIGQRPQPCMNFPLPASRAVPNIRQHPTSCRLELMLCNVFDCTASAI